MKKFSDKKNTILNILSHDLAGPLKEIIEEYRTNPLLTQKGFRFVTSADTVFLYLDDNKVMQSINNLLSNAIKFTPDGGEITVLLEEKEGPVLIRIADTGIGIPEKYHDTLFDKFRGGKQDAGASTLRTPAFRLALPRRIHHPASARRGLFEGCIRAAGRCR